MSPTKNTYEGAFILDLRFMTLDATFLGTACKASQIKLKLKLKQKLSDLKLY